MFRTVRGASVPPRCEGSAPSHRMKASTRLARTSPTIIFPNSDGARYRSMLAESLGADSYCSVSIQARAWSRTVVSRAAATGSGTNTTGRGAVVTGGPAVSIAGGGAASSRVSAPGTQSSAS